MTLPEYTIQVRIAYNGTPVQSFEDEARALTLKELQKIAEEQGLRLSNIRCFVSRDYNEIIGRAIGKMIKK